MRQVKDGWRQPRTMVHAQAHVNAATPNVPVQAPPFTFLHLPNHLVRNSYVIPLFSWKYKEEHTSGWTEPPQDVLQLPLVESSLLLLTINQTCVLVASLKSPYFAAAIKDGIGVSPSRQ